MVTGSPTLGSEVLGDESLAWSVGCGHTGMATRLGSSLQVIRLPRAPLEDQSLQLVIREAVSGL